MANHAERSEASTLSTNESTSGSNDASLERISPDRLMTHFTKTPLMACVAVALGLHLLVVGGTSLPSILAWFSGKPPESTAPATTGSEGRDPNEAAGPAAGQTTQAVAKEPAGDAAAKPKSGEEALLEKHKDKPVVKRVTEKAQAKDIPKEPDPLLPLEATNPF